MNKLQLDFYDISCYELATNLIGKLLVRKLDDSTVLKGRIVETECYLGGEDKASHSYNNRRTPGNEPMYMKPGTAYVYLTYGMYHCFNISSKGPGAAVLLRAIEPVYGIEQMQELRLTKTKNKSKSYKLHELCNGPSKMCMSMDINKEHCNKIDLCESDILWVENDLEYNTSDVQIVKTSRVGIESAGEEWAKKPLRFYVLGNPNVSKRDKCAEKQFSCE